MGYDVGEMTRPEDVLEDGGQEVHDEGTELSDDEDEVIVDHDED
jgi:hypothetical protein